MWNKILFRKVFINRLKIKTVAKKKVTINIFLFLEATDKNIIKKFKINKVKINGSSNTLLEKKIEKVLKKSVKMK